MRYKINFVRTKAPGDESYIETHEYESVTEGDTVASALIAINKDLEDPIAWECSCLQKKCGACAMVINSQPKLACKTFVNEEIMTKEYELITQKLNIAKDELIQLYENSIRLSFANDDVKNMLYKTVKDYEK